MSEQRVDVDTPKSWLHSDRLLAARVCRPALEFMHIESASGAVLLLAAVIAVIWANLGEVVPGYETFWHNHVEFSAGPIHLDESLKHLVNDGLMTIFFFIVGLEIKRELLLGELRDFRTAALPAIAAVGGMVVPALIYVGFNLGTDAVNGWAVPMATDIAFSLGVLAILGSRIPAGARLFLLTLAIVDDIGAIAVIAIFYSDSINTTWLAVGLGVLALIGVASQLKIRSHVIYLPLAVIAWFAFLESGVHATIAGVIIGLLTPVSPLYSTREFDRRARQLLDIVPEDSPRGALENEALMLSDLARESVSPLRRAERKLHVWSAFAIIPIFAMANAGVSLEGFSFSDLFASRVAMGVGVGLLVGKAVGVAGFAFVGELMGLGKRPIRCHVAGRPRARPAGRHRLHGRAVRGGTRLRRSPSGRPGQTRHLCWFHHRRCPRLRTAVEGPSEDQRGPVARGGRTRPPLTPTLYRSQSSRLYPGGCIHRPVAQCGRPVRVPGPCVGFGRRLRCRVLHLRSERARSSVG